MGKAALPGVDHWPTPDQSTIEEAAMVFVDQRHPKSEAERQVLLAEVLTDPVFNAAVSVIWAGRLPTPDSYHQASRAWEKRLGQVKAVRDVLDRWRRQRQHLDDAAFLAQLFDQIDQAVRDE